MEREGVLRSRFLESGGYPSLEPSEFAVCGLRASHLCGPCQADPDSVSDSAAAIPQPTTSLHFTILPAVHPSVPPPRAGSCGGREGD